MKRRSRVLALLGVIGMLGSMSLASAEELPPVAATETLYISAGCPPSTPAGGTCTSTRWLGKTKGSATSNFQTAITPVDEVLYRVDGTLNWRDYASDESFRVGGYALRADQPLTETIVLQATGAAPTTWVHGRVEAVTAAGDTVTFGPLERNVAILPNAPTTVTFDFDIPDALEGVSIESATAYIAVRGVNLNAGHINQQGGSMVKIPFWQPAVAPVP